VSFDVLQEIMSISIPLTITLGIALIWTTGFSMTNRFPLRGNRNLGLLAAYISPLVFIFISGFKSVALTWLAFALLGAVIYFAWELFQNIRVKNPDDKSKVGLGSFLTAPFAWPIMIPEAIEYFLAEVGIIKPMPVAQEIEEAEQDVTPNA